MKPKNKTWLGRRLLMPAVVGALVLLCVAIGAYLRRPDEAALQLGWTVLAPGAGLLAVTWLAGLPAN